MGGFLANVLQIAFVTNLHSITSFSHFIGEKIGFFVSTPRCFGRKRRFLSMTGYDFVKAVPNMTKVIQVSPQIR